jgi:hypothetical protein
VIRHDPVGAAALFERADPGGLLIAPGLMAAALATRPPPRRPAAAGDRGCRRRAPEYHAGRRTPQHYPGGRSMAIVFRRPPSGPGCGEPNPQTVFGDIIGRGRMIAPQTWPSGLRPPGAGYWRFEPVSQNTQPVSDRSRQQISDIENSSSRDWRRNSRPSVRDVRYSSPETGPFTANPRECRHSSEHRKRQARDHCGWLTSQS